MSSTIGSLRALDLAPAIFKLLRLARGRSGAAIASVMGLDPRTYQLLEAGTRPCSLDHVARFSQATETDAYGILAAHFMGSPRFALRVADNRLTTILLTILQEFDEEYGDAIAELDANTIFAVLSSAFSDLGGEALAQQARRRRLAPEWEGGSGAKTDVSPDAGPLPGSGASPRPNE